MTYILFAWLAVSQSGIGANVTHTFSWRPLGEFHDYTTAPISAKDKCELAAKQLNLTQFQCVRSK